MEKRAIAPLVLGSAALGLAVAIAVLLVKVKADAAPPKVDPSELARAQARSASTQMRPTPSPPPGPVEPPTEVEQPRLTVAPPEPMPPAEAEPPPPGPELVAEPPAGLPPVADEGEAGVATRMTEANRLYDRGEYEPAHNLAVEVLKDQPDNVKMLRIATSSACIMADGEKARPFFDRLPERDRDQIARRCRRYGVEF